MVVVWDPNDDEVATDKSWVGVEWLDNGEDNGDPDGVVPACNGDRLRGKASNDPCVGE